MRISQRGLEIQESPIRKLKPFADQAIAEGVKVYFINIGQPDIPTPQPVTCARTITLPCETWYAMSAWRSWSTGSSSWGSTTCSSVRYPIGIGDYVLVRSRGN